MLDKNKIFDCKFALSGIIISDDGLEQHMGIINSKYKYNGFEINPTEQRSKIFARLCNNKKSEKVI